MSVRPIFPQFAASCAEYVRPRGFPRPFAALDWCQRCGQPDWAHQAGGADRMFRLASLGPDDMAVALAYLAEYSPGALDAVLEAIGVSPLMDEREAHEAPFCLTCGAPLAIFRADGTSYRHYRESDGDVERYDPGHPTVIGWRDQAAF